MHGINMVTNRTGVTIYDAVSLFDKVNKEYGPTKNC